MSAPGETSAGESAEKPRQPFVFDADIEASETLSASIRAGSIGLGGLLFCLGHFGIGVFTCGSGRTVLAALAVAAVGAVAAAGAGWLIGGWTVGLIRGRTGVLAAYATQQGFWRRTYGEKMFAPGRYYLGGPLWDDVPPGMTLEEYGRARSRAKRLELWSVPLMVVMLGWFFLVLAAIARVGAPDSAAALLLAWGAFASVLVGGPRGWLARWRRERDAIASWAGALRMDEFMQTRGWEWQCVGGWRRVRGGGGAAP